MLGRVANGIFWMYRYLERAENTARLLVAGHRMALTRGPDMTKAEWRSVLTTLGLRRAYEASYDDYTAGRFDLAIQGFQGFIQAFPRLANAADAQYNIGMSYYQLSKWTEARDAFQKVITDYPQNTDRVSEAFYKLGQTYERLTQVDNAKRSYETLIQKFPNSFSASQARQALDRLNKR